MRAGMEKLQVADRDEVMIQVGVPSATAPPATAVSSSVNAADTHYRAMDLLSAVRACFSTAVATSVFYDSTNAAPFSAPSRSNPAAAF
jgi:hypothetical protein